MTDPLVILQQRRLEEIGLYLRQLRQERGLSLRPIAQRAQIPLDHLKALEASDFSQLPTAAETRAIIQRYGNALGIRGQELALTFPTELRRHRP